MRIWILLYATIFAGCITTLASSEVAVPLAQHANAWKPGDKLPSEVLQFRDEGAHNLSTTDSLAIFREITNYPFLWKVMFLPCDLRIFEFAAARALEVSGPKRFFSDLKEKNASDPSLRQNPRFRSLLGRANERTIVVDGLFIKDKDMSREQVDKVFALVRRDLSQGMSFERVRKKYSRAYEYSYYETFDDGKRVKQTRTTVGNYGDYIISASNRSALPFINAEVSHDNAQALLRGQEKDVMVLRGENFGDKITILYRIREVYSPADSSKGSKRSSALRLSR